jgi:hypothetical protein
MHEHTLRSTRGLPLRRWRHGSAAQLNSSGAERKRCSMAMSSGKLAWRRKRILPRRVAVQGDKDSGGTHGRKTVVRSERWAAVRTRCGGLVWSLLEPMSARMSKGIWSVCQARFNAGLAVAVVRARFTGFQKLQIFYIKPNCSDIENTK